MHVTTVLRDLHAFLERQSILVYTECIFNRRTEHCKDDDIINRCAKAMSSAVRRAVRLYKKKYTPSLGKKSDLNKSRGEKLNKCYVLYIFPF
jgi:hypothetical protein